MIKTILVCAAACLGLTAPARSAPAGPLDPPAGPVAPTGKTLAEVEPRTALSPVNTPGGADCTFRITAPGSYYLTAPVVHTGQELLWSVVKIEASEVTLDLNGFVIDGGRESSAVGVEAVRVMPGHRRVRIHNGILRRAGSGVSARDADGLIAEDLHIARTGVGVHAGSNSVVRDCLVIDGFSNSVGVDAQSVFHVRISGCTFTDEGTGVRSNFGRNVLIEDCTFSSCGNGVHLIAGAERVSVIGCRAQGCDVGFFDASGAPAFNSFLKNVATGCTDGYVNVPHVATDPSTAEAWVNLEL